MIQNTLEADISILFKPNEATTQLLGDAYHLARIFNDQIRDWEQRFSILSHEYMQVESDSLSLSVACEALLVTQGQRTLAQITQAEIQAMLSIESVLSALSAPQHAGYGKR
jgi:hypothetical protein